MPECGRGALCLRGGRGGGLARRGSVDRDLDIVLELTERSAAAGFGALLTAGFRAKIPADPRGFADPVTRRGWIEDKGMRVLSFYDPEHNRPDVDIFVEYPLDFEELYGQADTLQLRRSACKVASVEHLIRMKQVAGRKKDLADIEDLREIERFKFGYP